MKRSYAAIDLFCGAGGLTAGLRKAGIQVSAGVDTDPTCRFPLEENNKGTRFEEVDVNEIGADELLSWYPPKTEIRILAGCAPCQPFSKYTVRNGGDNRWRLLEEFSRLVRETVPDVVTMENVAELKRSEHVAYRTFISGLEALGYNVSSSIVACADYGVPQSRRRLVVLARLNGPRIEMTPPSNSRPMTVRDAIGMFPRTRAGASAGTGDALHVSSALSPLNLARIRATPEGGAWKDWPADLLLQCHQRDSGKYYGSVYGRMAWDELAPTITTQCFGYGNGRFGHPCQDRAISLREAAVLQTFPRTYKFVPKGIRPTFKNIGRQIGNAVPVALGHAIGKSIMDSFEQTASS